MDYFKINQILWDAKTDVHFDSDFYDVKSFLAGNSSLNSLELEWLGDVAGKSILHLQCHFGLDTISLARMGADVVGVDFSEKAIQKAKELAVQVGTSTKFIQCNIYDLKSKLQQQFDIVFTSYGVIGWLPDLQKWAELISYYLKPGGSFILVEFHPVLWMFDYEFRRIEYSYFNSGPIIEEVEGTYADRHAPIRNTSVFWNHSFADIFTALLQSNMQIDRFEEFNYSPYNCFEHTVEIKPQKYQIRGLENKLPMLYAIRASKTAD